MEGIIISAGSGRILDLGYLQSRSLVGKRCVSGSVVARKRIMMQFLTNPPYIMPVLNRLVSSSRKESLTGNLETPISSLPKASAHMMLSRRHGKD